MLVLNADKFFCPKCQNKEIWTKDILKGGNLTHKLF